MRDIEVRQKKVRKERKVQRDKTHLGFLITQFDLMRTDKRYKINISWLKLYPQTTVYPECIRWFMTLKSQFKSKEILKLGCIPNYGYKNGRWERPKRLTDANPFWKPFQNMAKRLGIDEINRQRALIREVFQQIPQETFRCFYTGGKHPNVKQKVNKCRQNIPESQVEFHIQKLEKFWKQLIGRIQIVDVENENNIYIDSNSDVDADAGVEPIQNGENQQKIENDGKKSIIDGLEEYESVFQSIPTDQPSIRMEESRILPQNEPQIKEEKEENQPEVRSPCGSRFNLWERNHPVQQSAWTAQLWKSGLLTESHIEQYEEHKGSNNGWFFFQRVNSDKRGVDNLTLESRKEIGLKRGTQNLDLDFFDEYSEFFNSGF